MNNLWKKTTLTVILHDEISDKPVKKSYGNVIQGFSTDAVDTFAQGLATLTGLTLDHVEATNVSTMAEI
ncbi:hypothetical protein FC96_GL000722 [Secundilactobacillus kimchicus JCM 15530]|uniref:DUF1659 domain-containing protein n=1 Tax=Secundilactobacillus kimchicus JCM 15530 TaxID=1302272 RepID=A0A0R1HKB2_9LACO|nr:hypothetical protein [Secundilactobacillus kimchicus]KRK47101.1 hypothetical protein FC96_GL000722 [Secundilactobacillus kimchicus JCM 15530]